MKTIKFNSEQETAEAIIRYTMLGVRVISIGIGQTKRTSSSNTGTANE